MYNIHDLYARKLNLLDEMLFTRLAEGVSRDSMSYTYQRHHENQLNSFFSGKLHLFTVLTDQFDCYLIIAYPKTSHYAQSIFPTIRGTTRNVGSNQSSRSCLNKNFT